MKLDDLAVHDVVNPAPKDDVAAHFYVPRQDLDGTMTRLEDDVLRDLRQEHRVALLGPSGSGKSSLTAWLAHNNDDLASVRIPLAHTGVDVSNPAIVLEGVIGQLKRLIGQPGTKMALKGVSTSVQGGFDWLKFGAQADWAPVVTEHTPGERAEDALEVLQQVVDGLHTDGAQLVLVFDDTDKWNAAVYDDPNSITSFFHGVVQGWLTRLDGALIASVHNGYRQDHPNMLDGFNTSHELAPLNATAVRGLLTTRYTLAELDLADHVDDDAVIELVTIYQSREYSIRAMLQVLRGAIDQARYVSQDKVSPTHIAAAL